MLLWLELAEFEGVAAAPLALPVGVVTADPEPEPVVVAAAALFVAAAVVEQLTAVGRSVTPNPLQSCFHVSLSVILWPGPEELTLPA